MTAVTMQQHTAPIPTAVTMPQDIRPPVTAVTMEGYIYPQPSRPVEVKRAYFHTCGSRDSTISRKMDDVETKQLSHLLHALQTTLHPQAVSMSINMSKKIAYYTTQDGARYQVDLVNAELHPDQEALIGEIDALMHRVSPAAVRHADWKKGEKGLYTGPVPLQKTEDMKLPKGGADFAINHFPHVLSQYHHPADHLFVARRVHMAEAVVKCEIDRHEQWVAHLKAEIAKPTNSGAKAQLEEQKRQHEEELVRWKKADLFAIQCALAFHMPNHPFEQAVVAAEGYLTSQLQASEGYARDVAAMLIPDRLGYVDFCKARKMAFKQDSFEEGIVRMVLSIENGQHGAPDHLRQACQPVLTALWNQQATPNDVQNYISWFRRDVGLPPLK